MCSEKQIFSFLCLRLGFPIQTKGTSYGCTQVDLSLFYIKKGEIIKKLHIAEKCLAHYKNSKKIWISQHCQILHQHNSISTVPILQWRMCLETHNERIYELHVGFLFFVLFQQKIMREVCFDSNICVMHKNYTFFTTSFVSLTYFAVFFYHHFCSIHFKFIEIKLRNFELNFYCHIWYSTTVCKGLWHRTHNDVFIRRLDA